MTLTQIPGIPEPYNSQILDLLKARPAEVEVILFGSRAKGTFREGSDIDVALRGRAATQDLRDQILSRYEDTSMPWRLDLVIYDHLQKKEFKAHIDRVGKKLLC
jgi:predicted nucleotidyltransferase